jgi:hypothetical protein
VILPFQALLILTAYLKIQNMTYSGPHLNASPSLVVQTFSEPVRSGQGSCAFAYKFAFAFHSSSQGILSA